jgi:hypothetical protein
MGEIDTKNGRPRQSPKRLIWPMAAMVIAAIFAIGFGMHVCSIVNDADKVMEETAYQVGAFMPS